MFTFVTRNSLRSNWIHFESGFAYAKGIRVIPVAFLGADLAELAPPLSLLQGFNINSEEGLNNIIAVANEEFSFKHKEGFTRRDFIEIVGEALPQELAELGEFGPSIRDIEVRVNRPYPAPVTVVNAQLHAEARAELRGVLKEEGTPFQNDNNNDHFQIQGATINISHSSQHRSWRFLIDPGTATKNLELMNRLSERLRGPGVSKPFVWFVFATNVYCEGRPHVVSGKLSGIANLAPNQFFRKGDVDFKVTRDFRDNYSGASQRPVALGIGSFERVISIAEMRGILDLLFEKGLLHFDAEQERG
jgi:hypothetical protein